VVVALPTVQTVTAFEEFTGHTVAMKVVNVRPRVSGHLKKVAFQDGQEVDETTDLFLIDPLPFEAELARAEATVKQMAARAARLRKEEKRSQSLLKQNVQTQEEYDVVAANLAEAEAAVKAAEASRDLARLNLGYTSIKATLKGTIGRHLVDEENVVKADDTLLAVVVSLDPIHAYFDVDERTVLRIRRLADQGKIAQLGTSQMKVQVALADQKEFPLSGTIDFVDNQLDSGTGTLRLRAKLENKDRSLRPGFFIRLKLPVGAPHQGVVVPEEALGADQGQRYVYVVTDDNKVEYRRVTVGIAAKGGRVIDEGIKPTDRVIVSGLQRVRPGVEVTPKMAEPAPDAVAANASTTQTDRPIAAHVPVKVGSGK